LRLRKAGYEQMITEDVFVLHVGSATFQGSKEARKLIKVNKKLLLKKHPNAKFEHTRIGNLSVMMAYKTMRDDGVWSGELSFRQDLRSSALTEDGPRSIFKRYIWSKKIKNL
jgi:hypothetical protein